MAYQRVFEPKCASALVEDYPPSTRTHPQLHQGVELDPLRRANGLVLLGYLLESLDWYDGTEGLVSPARNIVRLKDSDLSGT